MKNTLKKRIDRLTTPEPTITIFKGQEFYITDTGRTDQKEKISVKFSVQFRNKQLLQLKGPALAIFICIALHINEQGQSWPSVKLISHETGYNKNTIFRCLKRLEFGGYINRIQKTNIKTGAFKSNVYQLFPKSKRLK